MNSLDKTPAIKVLVPFALGIVIAQYTGLSFGLFFAMFAFLLCLVFVAHFARSQFFFLFSALAIIAAGSLRLELTDMSTNNISAFTDLPAALAVEGMIARPVEYRSDKMVTVVQADTVWVRKTAHSVNGNVLLHWNLPEKGYKTGDQIVARGNLRAPPGVRNPGEFDYRRYLASQDIQALLYVKGKSSLLLIEPEKGEWFYRCCISPMRNYISFFIDNTLHGQSAALLKGLLLGSRGDIDVDVKEAFARAGVIHVLAVSGLHVGFILALVLGLFSFLRIPNPLRTILVIATLFFYALLTGFRVPVVRASIMASVFLLGYLVQRKSHPVNSIAAAGIIVLAWNPQQLFQAGFQLSFTAVLGILLIYKRMEELLHPVILNLYEKNRVFLRYVMALFLVTLSAQLATLPLTVFYFNRIPVVSLFINVLVIPLVGVIVALGFGSLLFSLLWWPLGSALANTNGVCLSFLIHTIEKTSAMSWASFGVPQLSLLYVVLAFTLLGLFIAWRRIRYRKLLIFIFLILTNFGVWNHAVNQKAGLRVTFLDVGQGDAALFENVQGKVMLVDTGDRTDRFDCGKRIIAPFLQRRGIKKIDVLVLTHPHSDHIGGAPYLVEHFDIGRIILPKVRLDNPILKTIAEKASAKNIPWQFVHSGDLIHELDPVLITVLYPTRTMLQAVRSDAENLNNSSIVLICHYYSGSILMTGDAEHEAEWDMNRYGKLLDVDVLKAGHHGSSTATGPDFRKLVSPQFAVVSVGAFNRFGLPSEMLLQNLQKEGIIIHRTDRDGACCLFVDKAFIRKENY